MAVKIPVYQSQQVPNNAFIQVSGNPNANPVAPSDAVGRGMIALSKGLSDVSDAFQRKDDIDSIVRAGKTASDASREWSQYFNTKAKEIPGDSDGAGFTDNILKDFDKYRDETLNNEPNAKARLVLSRQLESLRNNLTGRGIEFEEKVGIAYRGTQLENIYQNYAQMVQRGDMTYQDAQQNINLVIANIGLDPITRNKMAMDYGRQLAGVKLIGETERNPNGTVSALQGAYGLKGFTGAVQFTLDMEGGYNPADSNGTPTNRGINQKAYPKLDIKNLTEAQAREIYKTDFWDKIKGDEIAAQNPALALALFDTAVMAGTDKANKLLKQSGGDVNKFMDLREQFLGNLVKSDPAKYGKYEKAWANRNEKLRGQVASAYSADPDTAAAVRNIPADKLPGYLNAAQGEQTRQQNAALAESSAQSARMVVDAYPQTADIAVDLTTAKADAVRMVEQRHGKLTEVQRVNVENQVERATADRTRALRSTSDSYLQGMFDQLDANKGDLLALQKDPVTQRKIAFLTRADRERLDKYAGQVATGGTRLTDWTAYNELMENPAALRDMNLMAHKDKFSRDVLEQLQKTQASLLKGETNEQNLVENHTAVKRLLEQAGITNKKKQGEFDVALQGAIDTQLQVTGKKKLTQQEILGLANDLLVKKITDKGVIYDSTERAYKVEVPAAERVKIEAALRANGLPVTEYLIQQQYLKKLDTKK